jgi:hypothetical protein
VLFAAGALAAGGAGDEVVTFSKFEPASYTWPTRVSTCWSRVFDSARITAFNW